MRSDLDHRPVKVERRAAKVVDARPTHPQNHRVGVEKALEGSQVDFVGEAGARMPGERGRMNAVHDPGVYPANADRRGESKRTGQ